MRCQVLVAGLITWVVAAGCTSSRALRSAAHGLESESADVRREATLELGHSRVADPELRARLTRRFSVLAQSDEDPLVRSSALTAVATQQPQAAVELAKRLRTDRSPMVRRDAVKVLAEHGDASAVDVLIEIARNDPDARTRRTAVLALGKYDEPRVIRALIECLSDDSRTVAHAARDSLTRISGGLDLGTNAEDWKKWLQ
ncbi:MAG: hypothetical protein AMK75_07460 [Planctomycetes bacterium SM23_65]|nr:MAG: hypothetical protein AMK75_07460 [Planctomycetes bacterium SM23_65]